MSRRRISKEFPKLDLSNKFWDTFQSLYSEAISAEWLPRARRPADLDRLFADYVRDRRGDDRERIPDLLTRLHPDYSIDLELGFSDILVLDFILHQESNRVYHLCGEQGCGKTTLLHFIEAAAHRLEGPNAPLFLIINGLAKTGHSSIDALPDLLADEIRSGANFFPSEKQKILFSCSKIIRQGEILKGLRALLQQFADGDTRKIILILDNLDQLPAGEIEELLRLSVGIHRATRVGSIVVTRPPTMRHLAGVGAASAYFGFRHDLSAPKISAWLSVLGGRVAREFAARCAHRHIVNAHSEHREHRFRAS